MSLKLPQSGTRDSRSLRYFYMRRPKHFNSLPFWSAMMVLGAVLVLLVLPALVSTSPTELGTEQPLLRPSRDNIFGTDQTGRDVATRVLYGARISLFVALTSAVAALIAGGFLGAIAATGPKWIGNLVMRITEIALAFPGILLAIVLASAIGPSMSTTIIVLAIIYTPPMARVVRAAVFSEYGEDYVTAARLIGTRPVRLVGYHVGINAGVPVLVYTTLVMADAIVAEAALSFIGAGTRQPAPSWGNMIRDGQEVLESGAWWVSLFPGVAIVLTVMILNRFSDAIGRRLRSR
ncbi:ABC transporter permease subunit [Prauserella flavalba]|uniref:ABC transporter permease subunit n=1 Tax=Prauserella flavalba TaxID=1477506 RepID=UPI000D75E7C7